MNNTLVALLFGCGRSRLTLDSFALRVHARGASILLGGKVHDLTTIIKTAFKAHVVWTVVSSTILAHGNSRRLKGVVAAAVRCMRTRMSHSDYHNGQYYSRYIKIGK